MKGKGNRFLFSSGNRGISVIIVCFNSVPRLFSTFQHLSAQQLPKGISWEIVLVDNASTDGTAEAAQRIWESLGEPAPLRIIIESKAGTDHARRAGIFSANFPVFVFCDDDNWLQADYLQKGFSYLMDHQEVGLVCGESLLAPCGPVPDWFNEVQRYYAVGKMAERTSDMTHWGLWGAGLMGLTHAMRNAMPEHIPLLNAGRVGHSAGFGEDGEMCMRVALQGYKLIFYDQLKLWHCISPSRLNLSYRDALLRGNQRPAEVMGSYFRLFSVINRTMVANFIKVGYHLARWCSYRVFKFEADGIKFSIDFLYYIFGWKYWQTEQNKTIRNYWRYIQSKKEK